MRARARRGGSRLTRPPPFLVHVQKPSARNGRNENESESEDSGSSASRLTRRADVVPTSLETSPRERPTPVHDDAASRERSRLHHGVHRAAVAFAIGIAILPASELVAPPQAPRSSSFRRSQPWRPLLSDAEKDHSNVVTRLRRHRSCRSRPNAERRTPAARARRPRAPLPPARHTPRHACILHAPEPRSDEHVVSLPPAVHQRSRLLTRRR